MRTPNRLDFTPEEIDELIERLNKKCLQEKDYDLLADVLRAMVWLSFSLQEKELSVRRLRKIFGIKTESAKKLMELAHGKSLDKEHDQNSTENSSKEDEKAGSNNENQAHQKKSDGADEEKDKPKNHGHRPSTDYTEATEIPISNRTLKKGDICPECLKGKLFQLKPGTVLHIVGQPWLKMEIFRPERLRCAVCGKIFTAALPKDAADSRVDVSAKAIVTLLKYRGGVPFYRQEQIQKILGTPISASEIFEMTEEVANIVQPIYEALLQVAADAEILHNDDTKATILSRSKELENSQEKPERTGTRTSVIVAVLKSIGVQVGLFFTGWKHAGENLDDLLDARSEGLPMPIQECDPLSHNVPKNHSTQLGNCLAHLRRKFYELAEVWPREVIKIIGDFSSLFKNENIAPKDPEKRLEWHREKSSSLMDGLKKFCDDLIHEKKVEPNSSLGKAIAYMNNHWKEFTLFLRVPGVPLTNNSGERLIKRSVLNRKNSYFFRNETGAKIADILMSVMETCVLNEINPQNFLIAVQQNEEDVRKNPTLWLPWVYETRFRELRLP